MALRILPAVVILTVACQALDYQPVSVTVPSVVHGSAHMQHSDCSNLSGSISLNFSSVGLRRLDSYFTRSPNVSCLSFDSNEIEQVSPSTFRHMPNLLYLSLARNRLNFANLSQLEGHSRLRTLVLDENREASLTEGPVFQLENKFPGLLFLHARDCGFRDVSSLAFAPNLIHLYLASNDLAGSNLTFLDDVARFLRILDLSDNGLQRLDAGKLVDLSDLRLDGNRFDRLCATVDCDSGSVLALAGPTRLRHLHLARNAIANIDSSTFNYPRELMSLDLSDNQIQSIEDGVFGNLIHLRNLSLKGNQLSVIPDFRRLHNLHHLSLASNNLEIVRNGSLYQNIFLKTLDLSNNKIATVEPGAFVWQQHLKSLDLSNNKLTNLWLPQMRNLSVLYVNNNLLTSLDNLSQGILRNRAQLKEVYLQNNQITKVYSHSLNNPHAITKIPDIAFILFDAANSTVQQKNAEECKCDCSSNDINSLYLGNATAVIAANWPGL